LAIAAAAVVVIAAVVIAVVLIRHRASSSSNGKPLGHSLVEEQAWIASLNVGTVTWTSSPLVSTPRTLGSDSKRGLEFEMIGPVADLTTEDATALVGSGSATTASDQVLVLGSLAGRYGGSAASHWFGSELNAAFAGGKIHAITKTRIFGHVSIEFQTFPNPDAVYVQVQGI